MSIIQNRLLRANLFRTKGVSVIIIICLLFTTILCAGCDRNPQWYSSDVKLIEYTNIEYDYSIEYPEKISYINTLSNGGVHICLQDSPFEVSVIDVRTYQSKDTNISDLYNDKKALLQTGSDTSDYSSKINNVEIDIDTGHEYDDYYEIRYKAEYTGIKEDKSWWDGKSSLKDDVANIKGSYMWISHNNYIYELYLRTHEKVWTQENRMSFLWNEISLDFYQEFK